SYSLTQAADEKAAEQRRAAVGKCQSPAGTLLYREAADGPWRALGPQDAVHSRDLLVALPGTRAVVQSGDGAVGLVLAGNLPELSASPVLESSVVLHANPAVALDFTLRAGRVIVTNQRDKGPARVRLRALDQVWELNLAEPGASVGLELYGRWPRGVPFNPDPKAPERPTTALVLLVLKGNVDLRTGTQQHALTAPPGPAYFHWDSVGGLDPGPSRLESLPAWAAAAGKPSAEAKGVQQVVDDICKRVKEKPAPEVLADLLAADDRGSDQARARLTRRMAVFGLAALDDLPRLTDALADPKRSDVRQTAIEALRHWIGKAAGNDAVLYRFLIEQRKYTPGQAATVLHLLHSFSNEELTRPETYEALLAYLRHERLPIRELARWHLERLVPGSSRIAYDAASPPEQREKGIEEWRKVVQEYLKKPRSKPE
ncbi:MAG TPA: hypothetical protein VNK04_21260, partial [Gemmataceae bacterium]|nr:hypothetical protein [Gemmataceae bacterium]